ncbi:MULTISPECIES: hypothetical protein [unclassified Streptomyces]|uniref:hypothetical protein n=1 Tax=unclassified Streptomyces TaxID=2593676 RepID=UPI001CD55B71|nr:MULTISPECIES: hypothetical protein [unclassified Streptomyces]
MITNILLILVLVIAVIALVLALGYLAEWILARRHATFLRYSADQLDDGIRPEPAGIRYAADLIDPRTRTRTR